MKSLYSLFKRHNNYWDGIYEEDLRYEEPTTVLWFGNIANIFAKFRRKKNSNPASDPPKSKKNFFNFFKKKGHSLAAVVKKTNRDSKGRLIDLLRGDLTTKTRRGIDPELLKDVSPGDIKKIKKRYKLSPSQCNLLDKIINDPKKEGSYNAIAKSLVPMDKGNLARLLKQYETNQKKDKRLPTLSALGLGGIAGLADLEGLDKKKIDNVLKNITEKDIQKLFFVRISHSNKNKKFSLPKLFHKTKMERGNALSRALNKAEMKRKQSNRIRDFFNVTNTPSFILKAYKQG